MKLKTLKDLMDCDCSEENCDVVLGSEIKTEAIKDYNQLKNQINKCCGNIKDRKPLCEDCCRRYGIMVYIKWKNNITEEDLK